MFHQLFGFSLATAFFMSAILSICPDTQAQSRFFRGGNRAKTSQPAPVVSVDAPSQPTAVSIDSGSNIQSTPTGTTSETITDASSAGSGVSTFNTRAAQVTNIDRATAVTDTSIHNGGLNANVGTSANIVNTPIVVQGNGQSTGSLNGGTGSASTETIGASNYTPNGGSARGFAFGSVKGRR